MLELAENDFKTGIIHLIENLQKNMGKMGQQTRNLNGEMGKIFFKEQDRNSRILEILDV